ncbi:MAG: hypothetical protein ACP5Q5_10245 [Brevinematia bacterium]
MGLLRLYRDKEIIRKSDIFYKNYYLTMYPEVKELGIDPLWHFVKSGWKEGKNPSEKFDLKYYFETYEDVRASGLNPLVHYIKFGWRKERNCVQRDYFLPPYR